MQALQRLFGVTSDQRRIRRQDFHIAATEVEPVRERTFVVEAIIAFPELDDPQADYAAVPEFFHQMAADDEGRLKCRLRLQATWTDDGTLDGAVEEKFWAIRTLGEFVDSDCVELRRADRARIQMIYVPATRDGAKQVSAFLRGRLWRAINWSQNVRDALADSGATLNSAFKGEADQPPILAEMENGHPFPFAGRENGRQKRRCLSRRADDHRSHLPSRRG